MKNENLNNDFNQHVAKKRAEAEAKAKEFFLNKKERQTYFLFSGTSAIEGDDMDKSFYFAYTQEEVNHFIQLFIDLCNQDAESETDKVDTLAAVEEKAHLWEYENSNSGLDELFERCLDNDMLLEDIDPTPLYLYSMSCFYWDYQRQKISERLRFKVELTDEEYLYLLTEQLTTRSGATPGFNINDLVFKRPELARKINVVADSFIGHGISCNKYPFFVIFDEVLSDVEAIAGPEPEREELYLERDEKRVLLVVANTKGRELVITEHGIPDDCTFSTERNIKGIDADKVMTALEANTYFQMLKKLRDRFHDRTAFDDIKAWLDQSGIKYEM